jgi:hypothetical protein
MFFLLGASINISMTMDDELLDIYMSSNSPDFSLQLEASHRSAYRKSKDEDFNRCLG